MSQDRPDPMEILGMLMSAFGGGKSADSPGDVWRRATEPKTETPKADAKNDALVLAHRAVVALEDISLNTAAIRQILTPDKPASPSGFPDKQGRAPGGSFDR